MLNTSFNASVVDLGKMIVYHILQDKVNGAEFSFIKQKNNSGSIQSVTGKA